MEFSPRPTPGLGPDSAASNINTKSSPWTQRSDPCPVFTSMPSRRRTGPGFPCILRKPWICINGLKATCAWRMLWRTGPRIFMPIIVRRDKRHAARRNKISSTTGSRCAMTHSRAERPGVRREKCWCQCWRIALSVVGSSQRRRFRYQLVSRLATDSKSTVAMKKAQV